VVKGFEGGGGVRLEKKPKRWEHFKAKKTKRKGGKMKGRRDERSFLPEGKRTKRTPKTKQAKKTTTQTTEAKETQDAKKQTDGTRLSQCS